MEPLLDLKRKAFVVFTADNRLKLFNAESGQERREYVEKEHLTHQYTCCAWSPAEPTPVATKPGPQNAAAGSQEPQPGPLGFLAVGTSSSKVIIFDLDRGVVKTTFAVDGGVVARDLAFSTDGRSLYIASGSPVVMKVHWSTGVVQGTRKVGKKDVSRILVNPRAADVVLGINASLRIVNFTNDDKRKLEATLPVGGEGSASTAAAAAFSNCGRYLACAGGDVSRNIMIFDLESESEQPLAEVSMEAAVKSLTFRSYSSKNQSNYVTLNLLAGLVGGSACVVRIGHEKDENGAKLSQTTNIIKLSDPSPVLCGRFGSVANPKLHSSVTLALGTIAKPKFIDISLSQVSAAGAEAVTTLEITGNKRELPSEENNNSNKKAKTVEGGDLLEITADSDANAQTLGQKLDLLSVPITAPVLSSGREGAGSSAAAVGASAAPTSDSLVTLIEQALQSGDNSLLEQCLTCEDPAVIEETSKRMPASRVVVFLKKLVAKFEKRPSRGILLTRWLSNILRYHTGYLISIPDLARQLGGLSQMLDQRLSTLAPLSALGGRLDLLLGQVSGGPDRGALSVGEDSQALVPRKIYIEE